MIQEIELPVSELPFEAGERFSAVVEHGVARIIIQTKEAEVVPVERLDSSAFLAKWAGSLQDTLRVDEHQDDPRMLAYIQKYQLDS